MDEYQQSSIYWYIGINLPSFVIKNYNVRGLGGRRQGGGMGAWFRDVVIESPTSERARHEIGTLTEEDVIIHT